MVYLHRILFAPMTSDVIDSYVQIQIHRTLTTTIYAFFECLSGSVAVH